MAYHCSPFVRAAMAFTATLLAAGAASSIPATPRVLPAERMARYVEQLVGELGDADEAVRAAAGRKLAALGASGVPFLVKHLHHTNMDVAGRVRAALLQMAPPAGEARGGLELSAVPIGPRPRKGEAVTFWLTVRNAGRAPISLLVSNWKLTLAAADAGPPAGGQARMDPRVAAFAVQPLDPGAAVGFLMDADPEDAGRAPERCVARLAAVPAPLAPLAVVRDGDAAFILADTLTLTSQPVELAYAPEEMSDRELAQRLAACLEGKEGAEKELLEREDAAGAIRLGLRRGNAAERWKVFQLLCKRPRRDMADAAVEFIGRWGPRGELPEVAWSIYRFGKILRMKDRLAFFCRAAHARPYDRGLALVLAENFGCYYFADELAAVSRILLLVPQERLSPNHRDLLAWQLFANPDPAVHDPKRALEIIKGRIAEEPDDLHCQFLLAMMEGKRKEAREVAEKADSANDLNSIAWSLATAGRHEAQDNELAVRIARKAVDRAQPDQNQVHAIVDTLACTHARAGNYADAAREMERAWDGQDADDDAREHYAERMVLFLGWASTDPKDRADSATGIAGTRARDALVARLKTATDRHLYDALVETLRASFPRDPAVDKAIEDVPRPAEPEPEPDDAELPAPPPDMHRGE